MDHVGYLNIDLRPALLVVSVAVLCVVALQVAEVWAERRARERTRRVMAEIEHARARRAP